MEDRKEAWRRVLADLARSCYLTGAEGKGKPAGDDALVLAKSLGPLAEEAVQIVEAYAIGVRTLGNGEADELPPGFEARLAIILNGLVPTTEEEPEEIEDDPPVFQSELWQLLTKVRESAELSYAREIALVELDRRILLLLGTAGPLVPAELSNGAGVDKAQVSRSVKRLLEIKMVERRQIRSPVNLTRNGKALADRLLRLAELRNRELTVDIPDAELADFRRVVEKLLERAVSLYDQERALANEEPNAPSRFPVVPQDEPGKPIVLDRDRIISPLMTLSAYFSRSAALIFKRRTGLSNFETWVLNEIGRDQPIEWNTLVERLDRDHSQAGRTVNSLIERALVDRQGRPGRRHGRFSLTEEGERMYEIIQDASRQRSAYLMAPLSGDERSRFLATFEKVHRNAAVQLERERAFEEMAHR
ncbi:MarR family winged helix-turn-helix transcriptional regulator [Aurantiacibacter flavus]|uniref:MarR family winged helix-turn-helix transcriptional regulator n=1 Tax=Aurantiacibacter flavus TaxID=3145232 RepID=A0ABV0CWS3_9SPHN